MIEELDRLRLDLLEAERQWRLAEQDVAELKGQLRDCKAEDINTLRQASARAEVELQVKANEVGALSEKLAKAEQSAAEQKAALDAAVATMDGLRQSNADLNAALARPVIVNLLPAPAQTAPAATVAPQRPVTVVASSRKSGKVWAIACGVALVIFIAVLVGAYLKMTSINDDVDAVTGEAAALAVNKAGPAVSPASIKSTTPDSSPCPYASLNDCVNDMARRIGVVPSDSSIQRYGSYSCRRIGCQ